MISKSYKPMCTDFLVVGGGVIGLAVARSLNTKYISLIIFL